MRIDITNIKGNNARCPMCYDEINTQPWTAAKHVAAEKHAHLSRGTRAFYIGLNEGSARASSNFLCLHHAALLCEQLAGMLQKEKP